MFSVSITLLSIASVVLVTPIAYLLGLRYAEIGVEKSPHPDQMQLFTISPKILHVFAAGIVASVVGLILFDDIIIAPTVILYSYLIFYIKKKFQPSTEEILILTACLILGKIASAIMSEYVLNILA